MAKNVPYVCKVEQPDGQQHNGMTSSEIEILFFLSGEAHHTKRENTKQCLLEKFLES